MNGADKWYAHISSLDNIYKLIASILPRRLIYWCALRVGVYATANRYAGEEVPALLFMDALKRWDDNDNDRSGKADT